MTDWGGEWVHAARADPNDEPSLLLPPARGRGRIRHVCLRHQREPLKRWAAQLETALAAVLPTTENVDPTLRLRLWGQAQGT